MLLDLPLPFTSPQFVVRLPLVIATLFPWNRTGRPWLSLLPLVHFSLWLLPSAPNGFCLLPQMIKEGKIC